MPIPSMHDLFTKKNTANNFRFVFILNPISKKISLLQWTLSYDKFILLFFGNQYIYEVSM